MIQGKDGNFYGTAVEGGANNACAGGCGQAFEITSQGVFTPLMYSFCSQIGCADGEYPEFQLVQATDGDFYGVSCQGGAHSLGTIFRLTASGKLTTVYSFCSEPNCTDGDQPFSALVQDTDGKLYGTAGGGGNSSGSCSSSHGRGTVFSLSIGLGPFATVRPTLGKVGATLKILGTDLTGSTSVTFNGTPATFTISKSGTYINTAVPTGATTGPVQVVTRSGTLTSNVNFQVLP